MNLPNLETIFSLIWRASLQACVLIVAALLIQALAGKRLPARYRYALSLLVLLRLIVPATPASSLSVFNLTCRVRPAPAIRPVFPSAVPSAVMFTLPNQAPAAISRQPRLSWGRLAAEFWLCGVAVFLLAVLWRHRKFARWVARLPAVTDQRLIELVEQCKGQVGVRRPVGIASAPQGNSAAVFGSLRPYLLLPEGTMDTLERGEARLVLLHELLHIRRRDVLVNWISVLALALHWFNPLAWVAMRRLRGDQELACDAAVLGLIEPAERGAYGRTLLKHLHDFPAARMAAGLVPLITSRNNIKRRIIMITEFKRTGGLARGLFALLFAGLGGLTFTHAADDPKPAVTNTGLPPAAATTVFQDSSTVTPPKVGQDYGAEYVKQSTLLEQLRGLDGANHSGFIQALSATAPDPILNSLLEQELAQETRFASLKSIFGPDSPEMRGEAAVINDLKQKIDQRANGIIAGMSVQVAALKAAANEGLRRVPALNDMQSRRLEEWERRRIKAEDRCLEDKNTDNMEANMADDPEFAEAKHRLEAAREKMVEVEQNFGTNMPAYMTAKKQLEICQQKVEAQRGQAFVRFDMRADRDRQFLQMIQTEEQRIEDQVRMETDARQYR